MSIETSNHGAEIAQYHTLRWRGFLAFLTLAALCFFAHKFGAPLVEDFIPRKYFFVGCFMVFVMPLLWWNSYADRKFSMVAYKNGLEIKKFGFFPWQDIEAMTRGGALILNLPDDSDGKKAPNFKTVCGVKPLVLHISETPSVYRTILTIKIPDALTNIPLREFIKSISPNTKIAEATIERKTVLSTQPADMNLRTLFLGKDTSLKGTSLGLFWLIVTFCALYVMFWGHAFLFPQDISNLLTIPLIFFGMAATYHVFKGRDKNPRIRHYSKMKMFWFHAFLLLLFPFMVHLFLVLPSAYFYTSAFGKPFKQALYYEDKTEFKDRKKCRHTFESPAAEFEMMKVLCIKEDAYASLPSTGIIMIDGLESPIGRIVKQYGIPMNSSLHVLTPEQKAEIDQEWEAYKP